MTNTRNSATYKRNRTARLATAIANHEHCCICHQPIDYTLSGNHPAGPTLEHLDPVKWTGSEDFTQDRAGIAHRTCNLRKGGPLGNIGRGKRKPTRRVDPPASSGPARSGPAPEAIPLPGTWPAWWPVIPAGQSLPALMSAPHPQAVGSYGAELLDWANGHSGMHPKRTESHRWWQELVAVASLQHDSAGRLLFPTCLLGTPRQVGKSWWLRMLSMWRLEQAGRWGELQTVVHTAAKLSQAEGVWRPAAFWAARAGGYRVRNANGSAMIGREDGSAWIPQAATDQVGVSLSVSVGIVDEAWDVPRWVVDNGLVPTLAESASPQLWIVSTAGRPRAGDVSDLYPAYRSEAVNQLNDPRDALIVEWSAPGDADPGDPATWRAAAPFWDERRAELLDREWRKAVASDSVDVFRMQWLNQWPSLAGGVWLPTWAGLRVAPVVWQWAAVEAAYGFAPVVAWAGRDGDRVVVSVEQARSTGDAAALVRAAGVRAVAGKSLLADAVWDGIDVEPRSATSARAVTDFRRLVVDGVLHHDGSALLSDQVAGCRVDYGPSGARVVSQGRVDAIKAALWAAQAAWAHEPWFSF